MTPMVYRRKHRPRKSRLLLTSFLFLLVIAGLTAFILFFEGEKPRISLEQVGDYLGKNGVVQYTVSDKSSGIRSITVYGVQGDLKKVLHSVSFPRTRYLGTIGPLENSGTVKFDVEKEGFVQGPMKIIVTANDFSLRGWLAGNQSIAEKQVTIDTVPPRIEIIHSEKYISPGGTGIAIYRISDKDSRNGVTINGYFNPGFPLASGSPDIYISFFALPFDAEAIESLNISATDPAGNSTVVPFSTIFQKANQKRDTINLGENFLTAKIPEFQQHYPEMHGALIDKYLYANSTVRDQNNGKISELCKNPLPERLWENHFTRMPGSTRAGYADHRTYYYQGQPVDQQVHLGMDIASTSNAEVRAANYGKVIYADYLGIYGNMVLLDHGQGVFSLYSHLSKINVIPGDMVDQKTAIGLTGTTGMAGGDHLHFSMLVNGVFVTPKEWWDQHWVNVTILQPIADAKS